MSLLVSKRPAQADAPARRLPLPALTSLRFVAASMIVVGHAAGAFGGASAIWVPLNQGVSFFFVLSGFILFYNYPAFDRPGQVTRFIVARIARIWPCHIACLALFLLVLPRDVWYIPYPTPTLGTLLALNVLLVQSWIPFKQIVLSLNGVAWSISVELFFYLAFPLLVFYGRFWRWHLAGSVAMIAATIWLVVDNGLPISTDEQGLTALGLLYTNPLVRLLEFQSGILAARVFLAGRQRRLPPIVATMVEAAAILVTLLLLLVIPSWSDRLISLGPDAAALGFWLVNEGGFPAFALLLIVMARHEGAISRLLSFSVLQLLGEVSFAVYLAHVTLLRAWPTRFGMLHALPPGVQYGLYWAMLLVVSLALHMAVERPARRAIIGLVGRRAHQTAS